MPQPLDHPAVQRVLAAALRKGITLEIVSFDESTHTAEQAAAAVGAELGQIVKSLVFVAPRAGRSMAETGPRHSPLGPCHGPKGQLSRPAGVL